MWKKLAGAARGEREVHFAGEQQARSERLLERFASVTDAFRHRRVRHGPLSKKKKPKPGRLGEAEASQALDAGWWSAPDAKNQIAARPAADFPRSDSEETVEEKSISSSSSSDRDVHGAAGASTETPRRPSVVSSRATSARPVVAPPAGSAGEVDPWADSDADPWADSDDDARPEGQQSASAAVQAPPAALPAQAAEGGQLRPKKAAGSPQPQQQPTPQKKKAQSKPAPAGQRVSAPPQGPGAAAAKKKAAGASAWADPWASSGSDGEKPVQQNKTPPKASKLTPKPAKPPGRATPANSANSAASNASAARKGNAEKGEKKVKLPKEAQANKKKPKDSVPKKPLMNEKVEHFAAF